MKRKAIILLAAALVFLCGCSGDTKGQNMCLSSFSFVHTGSSSEDGYSLIVYETAEGVQLLAVLQSGARQLETVADEAVLQELSALCERYGVFSWDGFRGRSLLPFKRADGDSFTISITFADGSTLEAEGSSKKPERYREFEAELRDFIQRMIEKYEG